MRVGTPVGVPVGGTEWRTVTKAGVNTGATGTIVTGIPASVISVCSCELLAVTAVVMASVIEE